MKLWYLYAREATLKLDHALFDGHVDLLNWLLDHGAVDDAIMFCENGRWTGPKCMGTEGRLKAYMMPDTSMVKPEPGDVVWIRGAWKSWWPLVESLRDRKIWLLFYDSGTGRRSWPAWDLIFDDLIAETGWDRKGRLWWRYPKPVSKIFHLRSDWDMQYDVCLGASYIYDRKGQYRSFAGVKEYDRLFGQKLRCVMPGSLRYAGAGTKAMIGDLDGGKFGHVRMTGELSRPEMVRVYNTSRLFCYLGVGYGDRSPVEAAMCGCPLIIGYTKSVPWYVKGNERITHVVADPNNGEEVARAIRKKLDEASYDERVYAARWFHDNASIEKVAGPSLMKVFSVLRAHPVADRKHLEELCPRR